MGCCVRSNPSEATSPWSPPGPTMTRLPLGPPSPPRNWTMPAATLSPRGQNTVDHWSPPGNHGSDPRNVPQADGHTGLGRRGLLLGGGRSPGRSAAQFPGRTGRDPDHHVGRSTTDRVRDTGPSRLEFSALDVIVGARGVVDARLPRGPAVAHVRTCDGGHRGLRRAGLGRLSWGRQGEAEATEHPSPRPRRRRTGGSRRRGGSRPAVRHGRRGWRWRGMSSRS